MMRSSNVVVCRTRTTIGTLVTLCSCTLISLPADLLSYFLNMMESLEILESEIFADRGQWH